MTQNMGKNVKAILNTNAMDINALPDSLKEYGRKLASENEIDPTEMFMALARAIDAAKCPDGLAESVEAIERYIRRPWWRKLLGLD